jgi:hypothetical protein
MEDEMTLDETMLNSELVEKLKLLNYEKNFTKIKGHKPLSKTYFCQKNGNGGEQNVYFIALASWLVNQCGGKISGDQKYEDPVTMATTLLTEMKKCGIDTQITPNNLRQGYGIPVLEVLISLCDKLLKNKNFNFAPPKFDDKKSSKKQDTPEIEDEVPNLINSEIDYGDNRKEEEEKKDEENVKSSNQTDNDGTGVLYSGIPTEDWHRELEKVSSKLKMDYKSLGNSYNQSEWRLHIKQIHDGGEKFKTDIPDSRGILEALSTEIDKSLEKIIKKEELLSKNHGSVIAAYKEKNKNRTNQLDDYQKLNEEVESLKREKEEMTDKIAACEEQYENLSKTISDTTKLQNTKAAIQNLQNESITLDMKINILNHSLLKYALDPELNRIVNGSEENNVGDASMFEDVL